MRNLTLLVAVLASLSLLPRPARAAGEPITLRYQWKPGQTLVYRHLIKAKLHPSDVKAEVTLDQDFQYHFSKVAPNGTATVDAKITREKNVFDVPFTGLDATRMHLQLEPSGRVAYMHPADDKETKEKDQVNKLDDEPPSSGEIEMAAAMIGYSDLFAGAWQWWLLPQKPVAVGETWEGSAKYDLANGKSYTTRFQGSLKEIKQSGNKRLAIIDGKLLLPDGKDTWTETITFDVTHGRVESVRWKPSEDDPTEERTWQLLKATP